MHGFFLCWRYLRKRRIAFFGVMAVGLCVALLIVITSLFRGFLREFDRHWEQQFGQIELQTGRLELAKWAELSDALEGLASIERAVAVAETPALLYLGRGDLRPVQLVGVPAEKLRQERTFREGLLLQGSEAAPSFELSAEAKTQARQWMSRRGGPAQETLPVGAIVGIGLLGRPDEQTDEYDEEAVAARIEAQKAPMFILYGRRDASQDDEALPAVRKVRRRVWVTDAVETGQYEADTRFVYLPFDYVRQLVGTETAGQYHCAGRMRIYVREGWTTPAALEQVRQRWAEFCRKELGWSGSRISQVEVKPSLETDYLRMITREIRKQLAVMEVLMGLIFSVAALLVFVIMLMIVMQKRRDIGIMRAVGSSRAAVAALFLLYGGTIGTVGGALGVGLGWWATRHIALLEGVLTRLLGFKIWKAGVYVFAEIPNEVYWPSVGWIVLMGVVAATVGALLPAVRAARVEPIEALRWE